MLLGISVQPLTLDTIISIVATLVLLICSALVSGAEVAFFSLSPSELVAIDEEEGQKNNSISILLSQPKKLLATILIANNLVNIAIIILSTIVIDGLIDFNGVHWIEVLVKIIGVTFILLLMGEVIPKVYATQQGIRLARFMALPLTVMQMVFNPLSRLLMFSTSVIDKRIQWKARKASSDDLSQALELTSEGNLPDEEHKILEGIIKFGGTDVKQIMKSRVDITVLDIAANYNEVLEVIRESGYSRIPVYEENLDSINGILYIKDLLPRLEAGEQFKWQNLLRAPFFVPENKKIDDLLKEFQAKKMHLAIVVDEYGGTSGIVTLEDILEEIVGEISDEFDEEMTTYSKIDDDNYLFEGKTPLIDLYKVLDLDEKKFEEAKGEADTVAGFIIEIAGKIPKKMEKVKFENCLFTIESADVKRVKKVKVTLQHETKEALD